MMSRQLSVTSLLLKSLSILLLFSGIVQANEQAQANTSISKEGKTYISGGLALNEFRSISLPFVETGKPGSVIGGKFPLTAQTYGLTTAYGTYIAENFKTEIRYGTGIRSDTVDEMLEININYVFNWYIGGTLPVTENFSAYSLIGVSFYDADIIRHETTRTIRKGTFSNSPTNIQPYPAQFEDGLFGTKFSMSWMLGLDYRIDNSWYLAFEYGRLLKDTDTNIKVYQASTQLRYEF